MGVSVTVAVPTYNRRATLERAVASALAQTHADLEVVVYDDASTDGTGELLAALAQQEPRLRVVSRPTNVGMVANMEAALRGGTGELVMLLADDDWVSPDHVARLVARLEASPTAVGAVGRVSYEAAGVVRERTAPRPLTALGAGARVADYFGAVHGERGNSWLYALLRRGAVERLSPLRNVLAFDWLLVAEVVAQGPVVLEEGVELHRELGGVSATTAGNVRSSGLSASAARIPHLVVAALVLAHLGWRSPVLAALGRGPRLLLAVRCAAGVPLANGRHVAFHLAPAGVRRRWSARR